MRARRGRRRWLRRTGTGRPAVHHPCREPGPATAISSPPSPHLQREPHRAGRTPGDQHPHGQPRDVHHRRREPARADLGSRRAVHRDPGRRARGRRPIHRTHRPRPNLLHRTLPRRATAIQACATDPRCASAIDLDGTPFGTVVHTGLHAPLLIIGSENSCVTGTCQPGTAEERGIEASTRTLLAASDGPTWCCSITGTGHFNFTDYAAYYLATPLRQLVPLGPIDGDRGLTITNAYLTAFLDHTVRTKPEPLLTRQSHTYTEMQAQHLPS